MLNEGCNLTDCRVGIFGVLNSSDIMMVQKTGRILRHKEPVIIIPYYVGTREEELKDKMLENYNPELIETAIKPMFSKYGILIIVLTAVTPIPYKLLAIWLGFIGYPIFLFLAVSAIFRTGRFAILATLLYFFQERANAIVNKYFWPLTIGAIVAAVLGITLIGLF
jgi:membrane protein DedA with SNARE-associated domain